MLNPSCYLGDAGGLGFVVAPERKLKEWLACKSWDRWIRTRLVMADYKLPASFSSIFDS